MCNMCHVCGAVSTMSNECKENHENENSIKLNGNDAVWPCKFCGEKKEKESIKQDGSSPYATPLISPTRSLTSSDSTVSSCSDFSVDACQNGRGYQEEVGSDSCTEDLNFRPNGHHQNLSCPIHENGIHRSNMVAKDNVKESSSVNNRGTASRDAEIVGNGDNQEAKDNACGSASLDINLETETAHSSKDELDFFIWIPPYAEDIEDDIEDSVVNYDDDDDDECGDGTKWGKPCSLSSFGEEGSGSYRFRAEKQKAMEEVMNGKFKALVC